MYARIEDGELRTAIPLNGWLKNGTPVRNYRQLMEKDAAIRASEGWKELEEIKPGLDENQHYVQLPPEEQADKIVVTYVAEDIPQEAPETKEAAKQQDKADWAGAKNTDEKLEILARMHGLVEEGEKL